MEKKPAQNTSELLDLLDEKGKLDIEKVCQSWEQMTINTPREQLSPKQTAIIREFALSQMSKEFRRNFNQKSKQENTQNHNPIIPDTIQQLHKDLSDHFDPQLDKIILLCETYCLNHQENKIMLSYAEYEEELFLYKKSKKTLYFCDKSVHIIRAMIDSNTLTQVLNQIISTLFAEINLES